MAADQLKAEAAIGREKQSVMDSPMLLQARVAFYAFTRTYPEHPLARNWTKWLEVFDDIDDLEEQESVDPTRLED